MTKPIRYRIAGRNAAYENLHRRPCVGKAADLRRCSRGHGVVGTSCIVVDPDNSRRVHTTEGNVDLKFVVCVQRAVVTKGVLGHGNKVRDTFRQNIRVIGPGHAPIARRVGSDPGHQRVSGLIVDLNRGAGACAKPSQSRAWIGGCQRRLLRAGLPKSGRFTGCSRCKGHLARNRRRAGPIGRGERKRLLTIAQACKSFLRQLDPPDHLPIASQDLARGVGGGADADWCRKARHVQCNLRHVIPCHTAQLDDFVQFGHADDIVFGHGLDTDHRSCRIVGHSLGNRSAIGAAHLEYFIRTQRVVIEHEAKLTRATDSRRAQNNFCSRVGLDQFHRIKGIALTKQLCRRIGRGPRDL